MPYRLIKGTFHLTSVNKNGKPIGFKPDGDSFQFKPNNPAHLDELERVRFRYRLSGIESTNLRFEGIDATELHYSSARQPQPFAEDARDFLTATFGMDPVTYTASGITVKPPANDGQRGYILSKQLDYHGRPVSFVFLGTTQKRNGEEFRVKSAWLRSSLNYKLLKRGLVYPLFYDTLYHDLRETMRDAAIEAFNKGKGLWPDDWSNDWVDVADQSGIEQQFNIYPKIFRRLISFHKEYTGFDQKTFKKWLEKKSENDEVWLRPEWNKTHLDNIVEVKNDRIRMTRYPEDLVFVSSK